MEIWEARVWPVGRAKKLIKNKENREKAKTKEDEQHVQKLNTILK